MTVHIALLRAVNVAGHNKVAMADLRELLMGMGMKDVRSLLQSGNLVFESTVRSTARLEGMLKEAAKQELGLETDFLVRSAKEWSELVAANPLAKEAQDAPSRFGVIVLSAAPTAAAVTKLRDGIQGREILRVVGRQAYIAYVDGIGRSRLTARRIEDGLGARGTGRNWNTVLKLDAMASGA